MRIHLALRGASLRAAFSRSGIPAFVLLAPLLVAAALTSLSPEPAQMGAARPCAGAQLIAGELRCEEELLVDAPAPCPSEIGPGDAVGIGPRGCEIGRMPPEQLAALGQIVDLNTASIAELASLPGIGPVLAERIVAGRPYASVDALLEVRGIGPTRLEHLRPRARVRPRPR